MLSVNFEVLILLFRLRVLLNDFSLCLELDSFFRLGVGLAKVSWLLLGIVFG